jgi:D-inositol-3-phosphate glycosyltransferase
MVMFHTLAAVKNQLGLGAIESDLRIQEETRTMQTCQAVVVATEREKQSMVEFYKANPAAINIIPCGVNLDLFRPMDPFLADQPLAERLEKTILYVGRIEPLKGIDILINALALLSNRPDWRCLIVGGGPSSQSEVARLKKLSKKLKLETRLDFTGIVHQEKLPGYYNKAHVLVVPSLYESFGLVALEALASGCPVVASDVGDLRNIITPGFSGEVIETMDASNLAFSLRSWLDHPERDQSARQAIHQTVERFGWKRVALQLVNKIERLSPVVYPS